MVCRTLLELKDDAYIPIGVQPEDTPLGLANASIIGILLIVDEQIP